MRQLSTRTGRPRWRGLARRCRQLQAWAKAQAGHPPTWEASFSGEVLALVRAPVKLALLPGPQGRAHRRAVVAALLEVLGAWRAAARPSDRVVLYLRPEDLWDSSVDWHGDAVGMSALWAAWEAQGAWVRAEPPLALRQAWGLAQGESPWAWFREADGEGGWRWLALAGDLGPWVQA